MYEKEKSLNQEYFTEFNKRVFVDNVKSLVKEQRIKHEHLRDLLGCSEKTLGYYLNPERPELPKLAQFVRLFQGLNTSPGHLLINRGPRLIDPRTSETLFDALERMADKNRPSMRVAIYHLSNIEEQDLRSINKLLEHFNDLADRMKQKILGGLLYLVSR